MAHPGMVFQAAASPALARPAPAWLAGSSCSAFGAVPLAPAPIKLSEFRFFEPASRGAALRTFAKRDRRPSIRRREQTKLVQLAPDGSDVWRLASVIRCLQEGGVAILPTDTFPALVCDVASPQGIELLYNARPAAARKPLSILVRGFSDIDTYTRGFPEARADGAPDLFRVARRVLPGPFTLILPASKALPKRVVDVASGRTRARPTVGVRMPASQFTQTVLAQLDRPLLATSAHVTALHGVEFPEAALLMDTFAGAGVDFVVDAGTQAAEGSTVIDLSGPEPVLVRQGKGDASPFMRSPAFA